VPQKSRKDNPKLHIRVYQPGSPGVRASGPGRAGPAMTGLFVEPFPLDFWKLERSFVRTPPQDFFPCHKSLKRFVRTARYLIPLSLSPHHRYACFSVIAFLVIPSSQFSEFLESDEKRCSSAHYVCHQNDGFVIIAVIQGARRPNSRSESPEILGRIVFFITAVGRSPPSFC